MLPLGYRVQIGGVWHCYYTAFPKQQGAVYCRTSSDTRQWSDSKIVASGGEAGTNAFSAECPFVVELTAGELGTLGNLQLRYKSSATAEGIASVQVVAASPFDAAALANAVWAQVIEGAYTAREFMRLAGAALFGRLSGAATTTVVFRDTGNTRNRISADVDTYGNRTTVTLDPG
jgi:hypothetical protein